MTRSDFVGRVASVISRHRLLASGARVIVGFSGGADSVALLAALVALGYDCVGAHMNYGLRGPESLRDEAHARAVASALGVTFCCRRVDMDRETRRGESLEMACRRLRYDWFESLCREYSASAVAVAHHREDSLETFFINAIRGSGVAGLCGIRPVSGRVVRPLLCFPRPEIEAFLEDSGLRWVDDSSNATDDYKRNRVRHHVLPALAAVDPHALDGVAASMELAADDAALLRSLVAREADRYFSGDMLDVRRLVADHGDVAPSLISAIMRPRGLNRAQTDLIAAAASLPGLRRFDGGWVLDDGVLRPATCAAPAQVVSGPLDALGLEVKEMPASDFHPVKGDSSVLWLDASVLDGDPDFTLRPWELSDRIEPFGMRRGSRLVSDIIHDARIPADRRREVRVLTRGGVILWVVGLRASRHFVVTPSSTTILSISL